MRTKKVSSKAMVGELRSLAMVGSGLVAGSMAGKAIDKMLKVDNSLPGFQAKKLVRPAAQLAVGVLGSLKLKNPDLKNVSAGLGAAGILSAVQVVLKKDLLNGVDGLGEPMSVYSEPLPSVAPYEPNLPALSSGVGAYESPAESYLPGEEHKSYQDAEFEII